ncbi:MAG: formylglycine-generating enzyme family protein [Candidatus Methanoperedens sp.]
MNNNDTPQTPIKPTILRESEFFGGCIRVKISVKNTSNLIIGEAALELENDENILHCDRCEPEYPEKKGKIILGNINPGTDRTIAFYLDPLICAKEGTDINCRIFYKDAYGRSEMVQMEPLKIKVICPIFRTEQEINIGRLKELLAELRFHDSKVYTFPKKVELQELLRSCRDVIQLHDVRHIKTFKTTDEKTYESWYYGKTKVTKKDLVIKCAIRRETESIEVLASGNDPGDITGLLAELGRNLTKEFEKIGKVQPIFNITIKDSVIQRSNLLSFCDLDGSCGGNVVIEDSVVQRSNIASWNRGEREGREKEEESHRKQSEDVMHIQAKKESERMPIEPEKKSSGGKWFLGVIIILAVLALGWYGTQDSSSSTISIPPKIITNSIGMDFISIHAGEFDMGSPSNEAERYNNEGPVHHVKIGKSFYMGKYEVTQKQWRDVMGTSPSYFKGDKLPVEQVSWNDVQEFIKKLNEKEGSNKYRLPSEAEWEYAARAGTTTRYSFGNDDSILGTKIGDYAWYNENSEGKTHEVGQKLPNPWGLYDMHGNVFEFVQDNWHENYNDAPTDGTSWLSEDVSNRGVRSGDWSDNARDSRSASRGSFNPVTDRPPRLGFRLLMDAPASTNSSETLKSTSLATPKVTQTISIPVITPAPDQPSLTNSIGVEFILISAGEFNMGSPSNEVGRNENEGPLHQVKISNAFYMGKYEVSQKQWRDVMGNNPSFYKGDDLPVEQVSWNDVQDFINKLNQKEGTDKYRLPTEAKWEYAARAGTKTRYSFGDDESVLGDYAWYSANSGDKTHEVGQKKPNPWGLYDMHGNVWEWVQDKWYGNYVGAPTDGSAWEVNGFERVVRGGGSSGSAGFCRSDDRSGVDQVARNWGFGFRLLREV